MTRCRDICWMLLLLVQFTFLGGCNVAPVDYSHYRPYVEHMPKSILVLPPVNHSANVHASEAFLSTISMPLAEMGYYVFPVSVVDRLFKENGVPVPGDMHAVPLKKIEEVIAPDAVLYVHIKEWTTTYIVMDTTSKVSMDYKLVDTRTGTVLWQNVGTFAYSSSQGADPSAAGLIAMFVAAQVQAIQNATSHGEYERMAAAQTNQLVFHAPDHGLLLGAHHADYAKNQAWIKDQLAKSDTAKPKTSN